ncbi:hypothetical protein D3C87_1599600 [compost metagenome]
MHRSRTAEWHKREITWIITTFHGNNADAPNNVGMGYAQYSCRRLIDIKTKWLGNDIVDGFMGPIQIKCHRTAQT